MSKRLKRLEKIRQNPKNVSYEDLETILLDLGFQKRQPASRHIIFSYPGLNPITIPRDRPFLKPEYVKMALRAIEEILDED